MKQDITENIDNVLENTDGRWVADKVKSILDEIENLIGPETTTIKCSSKYNSILQCSILYDYDENHIRFDDGTILKIEFANEKDKIYLE